MAIQWYPGHMHKASKELKKILSQVDIFIEVLDARLPYSSENPMLAEIRGDKPCIKILNKSDLADPVLTQEWQDYLEQEQSVKTIALTAQQPDRTMDILDLCHKMLPGKSQSVKNIQALIMGIPNVGKSTLINTLAGRQIARTGNEPAVTKLQQRIKLDKGIVLVDTPGMLWPNLENRHTGYRLAVTGAIKETAVDNSDIAFYAIAYLSKHYPDFVKTRYELTELPEGELEILETIGAKRGCLRAGGQVDLERVSKILLTEFRSMMLGRITLETPAMMERELIELEQSRADKAAKKAARKQKRHGSRA
ncbi:ribosome biogenesis GTPase YlqF [Methylophaga sp. 42_25_T18]|nr:ribosome biogenesis GTPase YlqF [Methylophaga sp. 42_25_T18]OUR86701.1 ribosome biogenesis GTPase YlqF [Methylophaga sp. 42_8_T64]